MSLFFRPAWSGVVRACLLGALVSSIAFAQKDTGELRLTVKDHSGSPVQAQVNLVNQASKIKASVHLGNTGRYTFRDLEFGDYLLTITHSGFSPSSQLIEVQSNVPVQRHVVLTIRPQQTSIEVTASSTLLNPRRTSATYFTGKQEINERPMTQSGRGLINLAVLQPGWTLEANGILHPRESEYDTQFIIDGFPVQDNRSPAFARPIQADNVVSMKQYTSGIPAEFGDKLGGVIVLDTTQNSSPGFHGTYVAQGGSFSTLSSFLSGQYSNGKTTVAASGDGFLTDRYLDPPTENNFTNHASSTSFTGSVEHDFNDANRLRVAVLNQQTWLEVPNDLLQQAAGQRQDRTSGSTEGQISYQHLFSPSLVGVIRADIRDVSAGLWSNPLSTPVFAQQDRDYRETYWNGSLAGNNGPNNWKAGVQGRYASEAENFHYRIVAYTIGDEEIFDDTLPPAFQFNGRALDREHAAYGQDSLHLGALTLNLGLRFDDYDFIVKAHGWSPRLAAAYAIRPLKLVVHASYDRTFGTPPFANLLVSSSVLAPGSRFHEGLYLPLRPSRGNYYEVGFSKLLGSHLRLDANWFERDVDNFEDDDLLVNTGVSFPIAFEKGIVKGTEVKLSMPHWGRFSAFAAYANTTGLGQYPISGGLFLDEDDISDINSHSKFPISQDIRNVVNGYVRYQIASRLWTAWTINYTSGLPVEDADDLPDTDFLIEQYGANIVNEVNFVRGRVHPSLSVNASVGFDILQGERYKATLQADVTNLADRLNVINFAGLLSGTAIATPRSASARLRFDF